MSKLKTMIPIAGVLALSVATVACAETTKAPASPVAQTVAKPTLSMEGKCGSNMKMDRTATQTGKPDLATGKAMEGKCGGMK